MNGLAANRAMRRRRGFVPQALLLPALAGNFLSTPDSPALSITGNIDIRAQLKPTAWTGGVAGVIVAKADTFGSALSWYWQLNAAGGLRFRWSTTGLALAPAVDSSAVVPFVNGSLGWVRVTFLANDGAGGWLVTFYYSPDAVAWAILGAPVPGVGPVVMFDGNAPVYIGAREQGNTGPFGGKVLYAEVRNGIGGPVVASPSPRTITRAGVRNPNAFNDAQGNTWTAAGAAWDWAAA